MEAAQPRVGTVIQNGGVSIMLVVHDPGEGGVHSDLLTFLELSLPRSSGHPG